jgi:cytochrome bd-type quinol oxidase subunit 2
MGTRKVSILSFIIICLSLTIVCVGMATESATSQEFATPEPWIAILATIATLFSAWYHKRHRTQSQALGVLITEIEEMGKAAKPLKERIAKTAVKHGISSFLSKNITKVLKPYNN